jgi:hypothetical protein
MPRPATTVALVLALATAGSLLYAWHLQTELDRARTELAARLSDTTRLRAQLDEANRPISFPAGPRDEPTGSAIVPGPGNDSPAIPPGRPANAGGPGFVARRDSPETQHLMAMQRRAALDGRYAALFRQLNLNPADLERLKALLVEKQTAASDVFSVARAEGLNPRENREQISQLVAKFEAESDDAIRSTLGESVFQQYQQYEQTLPQRNVASQLEQRLSYSSTPLNSGQTEQLVRVLAAASPATRGNPAAFLPPGVVLPGRGVTITDSVIAQSQGFLSAPQVESLRQLQQEQAAQAQLRQQMQQTRRNAGSTTPPSGP